MLMSVEYYLTYWNNGCFSKTFYSLRQAYNYIVSNNIYHYDLVDNRGVVYHGIF